VLESLKPEEAGFPASLLVTSVATSEVISCACENAQSIVSAFFPPRGRSHSVTQRPYGPALRRLHAGAAACNIALPGRRCEKRSGGGAAGGPDALPGVAQQKGEADE
jgi:hypothetical protein